MRQFFDRIFNHHKAVRRLTLVWACWLITVVVLRVTREDLLTELNGYVISIVTAVIGILSTVIGFYQWSRRRDDGDCEDR